MNSSSKQYYDKDYEKIYDKGYEKSYDRSYDKQQSYSKSPEKHLPALRNNKVKYGINSSLSNRFNSSALNTYSRVPNKAVENLNSFLDVFPSCSYLGILVY